jgi:hypothetical protein|tara:strand:- start:320 stop:451 length:132 start_codon:yes stop_codon:yes gene_type:complete
VDKVVVVMDRTETLQQLVLLTQVVVVAVVGMVIQGVQMVARES